MLRTMSVPGRNWLLWAYALLPLGWVACSDVMVEYSLCLLGMLLGCFSLCAARPQWQASLWAVESLCVLHKVC
ncbi:MAG: hypothetical protein N2651_04425 [Fimbriimonadales bacterium]|nr:hypothetical protein [Fimbriimonadales bacterium]